jgi:hypothetical protein
MRARIFRGGDLPSCPAAGSLDSGFELDPPCLRHHRMKDLIGALSLFDEPAEGVKEVAGSYKSYVKLLPPLQNTLGKVGHILRIPL